MKQGDKFFKNSENLDFIFNNFIKKKICVLVLPSLGNRNIFTFPYLFYFYSTTEYSLRMLIELQSHFCFKRKEIKVKKFKSQDKITYQVMLTFLFHSLCLKKCPTTR